MGNTPESSHHTQLRSQKHGAVTWVDSESPNRETLEQLERTYKLHPVHVHESLQKIQHNQVERAEEYLFFVLHVPIFHGAGRKIVVNQVGVFVGKNFLITIRSGSCPTITDLYKTCDTELDQAEANFKRGPGQVLYVLISRLLESISNMADEVIAELDELEDLVFDNSASDAQQIGKLRQKIVRLRRVIGPKRIILQDLAEQINSFTGKDLAVYYANNTKAANRLWEVIEEAKETVEIFKDADFTTSTEQTNKILAILTLVFTFTIPITVVGTLYGMNVKLPGGIETGSWNFWGEYTTFGIIVAVSAALAGAMYVYFKQKRWF